MLLSIVIPARNEEQELPGTLDSVRKAVTEVDVAADDIEVIVVDDGSTDRTAEIAASRGATVLSVAIHNIGQVRNAGAEAASGDWLVFLDADTRLPAETLQAAIDRLRLGHVGGGARIRWDRQPPLFGRLSSAAFLFWWQTLHQWAAGCFIWCRRDAFEAIGGFAPEWLAAEERPLSIALREHGRPDGRGWSILKQPVVSSARKMRLFSTGQLIRITLPLLFSPSGLLAGKGRLKTARGLEFFYDAPRETAEPVAAAKSQPPAR